MPLSAVANALFPLVLLACPVGMGLMMWFMGRGMMGGRKSDRGGGDQRSLSELEAEYARLAAKIAALERRDEQNVQSEDGSERHALGDSQPR